MRTKTKALVLSGTIALSLFAYNVAGVTTPNSPPAKTEPIVATEAYIDQAALITALTETPELVGLTGQVAKTVGYTDAKWYGDKEYEMTVTGEFKLGIDTEDLDISVNGNTITVRLPQPELLTADFPFDTSVITKDVGLLRNDLDEAELQAMYGKARAGAINEIKADDGAFERAEDVIERTIERVIVMVTTDSGINVKFEEVAE